MCDYSLQHVVSRSAKIGDRLVTCNFGLGTSGFTAHEQIGIAVCLLPGTELAFANDVTVQKIGFFRTRRETVGHRMAMFRQVDQHQPHQHHDALEFPDGQVVMLTLLFEGQQATVLQLPAQARTITDQQALSARPTQLVKSLGEGNAARF
jgi:hypothetical protein